MTDSDSVELAGTNDPSGRARLGDMAGGPALALFTAVMAVLPFDLQS